MRRRILKATYLASLLALGFTSAGLASLGLALASSASAGEYHVYSCRTPSGEVAPADGWVGAVGPTYDDYATDTCATGGALIAALGDVTQHQANLDQAQWGLSIPTEETMVGATVWRAGDTDGGEGHNSTNDFVLAGPKENEIFGDCSYEFGCMGLGDPVEPLAGVNREGVPSVNLGSHLYVRAWCVGIGSGYECPRGVGDANGYAVVVYLYAADVVLEQNEGPLAKETSGPLATEATVQGTSDVTFNGSDPGAGVWEVTFQVDGKVVQSTVPDENHGRCRNVGQTTDGLAAFDYLQPCPPVESVDVGFDTAAVSNGEHHLVVSVLDPAGNSATVLDREINVQNPVPAAPAPAVVPVKPMSKRRARITLEVSPRRVGRHQSIHFSGQLLGGSIPKIGKLLVLERRLRSGKWSGIGEIRTGRQGRFHGSYRFNFLGPGDYKLRVLAAAERGYPYATGWSRVVGVRVS
jgi:hypothetical protein